MSRNVQDVVSYTLILSRGTHVISVQTAETILHAIANEACVVSVDIDILCDGFTRRGVQLVTSHIIALIPNEAAEYGSDETTVGANVTVLRRSRPIVADARR